MAQMSYAAAGAVAPGPGTTAGYVNYKALFDSIFAIFNADDAIIAAATSTGSVANAGKLAKFAGDGGLTLAGAFSAVNGAFSGTLNATGNTGLGGTLAVAGNTTLSGTLHVVGVSTFDAAITGTLIGTASGLTAPVALSSLISDYKPTTSGSAGQIVVGAGPRYGDSAGNIIGPLAAQAAPLSNANSASQPTGTNSQYVVVSLAPGTGAPVATGGAVAAGTPVPPVYPTANEPIALVLWRGATTNPTNVIAAGDITDLRGLGGSGGGGSAGADSGVRAAALWLVGTNAGVFSGAHDSTNTSGTETGWFNQNLLKSGSGDGTVADLLRNYIPLSIATPAGSFVSGATLTLTAGPGNAALAFTINGRNVTATSNIGTGVAPSGGAGPRQAYLDATTVGSPGIVFKTAGSSPSTWQTLIANVWWTGTAIDPLSVDWSPLLNLPTSLMSKTQIRADASANDVNILSTSYNGSAFVLPAHTPTVAAFTISAQQRVEVRSQIFSQIQASFTAGDYAYSDVYYSLNGGTYAPPANTTDGRIVFNGITGVYQCVERTIDMILPVGSYTLAQTLSYQGSTPSTSSLNLLTRSLIVTFYKG